MHWGSSPSDLGSGSGVDDCLERVLTRDTATIQRRAKASEDLKALAIAGVSMRQQDAIDRDVQIPGPARPKQFGLGGDDGKNAGTDQDDQCNAAFDWLGPR